MKPFLIFIFLCMFYSAAFATTVNYNWLVDGTSYAQTTCETGDDLILPTPTPTKYGYHFVGWVESEIFGSYSQSGTPTPQNPIEPVFKPFGNTVLRALGSGNDLIADSYDPATRTITRRIGVTVLDGTESWDMPSSWNAIYPTFRIISESTDNALIPSDAPSVARSQYFLPAPQSNALNYAINNTISVGSTAHTRHTIWIRTDYFTTVAQFKQWLADQYAAGTPVTVYYPLATPQQEGLQ